MLETGDESNTAGPGMFDVSEQGSNTAGPGMFDVSEQGRTVHISPDFFYCGRGAELHAFPHCQSDLSGISIVFST